MARFYGVFNIRHVKVCTCCRIYHFFCIRFAFKLRLFIAVAIELCIDRLLYSLSLQVCTHRPVFFRNKIVYLLLAVANYARGYGLHAACAKSLPYLCPKYGAYFITHQSVQHAPCLLRVNKVHIYAPWMLHGIFDRVCGYFIKDYAAV